MIHRLALDSPVGRLVITERDGAIDAIGWAPTPRDQGSRGDLNEEAIGEPTPLLREARRQIEAYFARDLRRFDLPLEPHGSPHDQRVWAAMRQIPYGETRSYSDLAFMVGSGPRAVGSACGHNPIPIVIPCHRVLAKGGIGGYSGGQGLPTKRLLLALESSQSVGRKSGAHSAVFSKAKAEYAAPRAIFPARPS